jgi:hypothetical protein
VAIVPHREPKVNRQNTQKWEKSMGKVCAVCLLIFLEEDDIMKISRAWAVGARLKAFVQNTQNKCLVRNCGVFML